MKFSNILISKKQFLCNKNHIALSWHVISFIDFARECNMIIYCTEMIFANQYVRKWNVTCIASGQYKNSKIEPYVIKLKFCREWC